MMSSDESLPLTGETVALPESRRLDVFASMLEKRGAAVRRCPLIAIHDAPDPEPVQQWIEALIAGRFEDVILYTGEGTRRLAGFAERAGRDESFVEALGRTRRITRGPKPVKALRELGLKPSAQTEDPTTAGVIDVLKGLDVAGHTIGVQMYGQKPNEKLEAAIRDSGASPEAVYPYVYASQAEDEQVVQLIQALAGGEVTIAAFTSSAQVDRLYQVAKKHQATAELEQGLRRTTIAAVGPVVGDALRQQGLTVDAMPDEPFALKPLMNAMIDARQRVGG